MTASARLPDTMLCMEITQPGPPDVMQPCRRSVPNVQPGEVLIRVVAAGVNRPDCLQRSGNYPPPPGASDLPGLEVAGIVVATADDVGTPAVGDRVCALVAGGGYAEYCTAPALQCLPVPAALTLIEAAAVPETFFTVWQNVFEIAALQAGEWLLVHGGTSGIGVAAIQLARARGAHVVATAGSADKCAACLQLGADVAVDYRQQDFVHEALAATGGRGVDVVLDMVAGDYVARELRCLADDGRLAIIAVQGGTKSEIDAGIVLRKRLAITGSTLRARPAAYKAALARALRAQVWPLIEAGAVRPVVHRAMPADEAAAAHALMESGTHVGKIVLTW